MDACIWCGHPIGSLGVNCWHHEARRGGVLRRVSKYLPDEHDYFTQMESLVLELLDETGENGLSQKADRILRALRSTTNGLVDARWRKEYELRRSDESAKVEVEF
jgi:hypothetical protein